MAKNLIENVYVINLERCKDRKQHIIKEFKKNGLTKYEFFKAVDKDDKQVKDMMKTDYVKKFPPCFRCAKFVCNCNNNVLIPQQIGNWCSFINLMKHIVEKKYTNLVMICEDDIKFTNFGVGVISKMINTQSFKRYNINMNRPLLIRCEQRGPQRSLNQLRFTKKIVMSNACFIVNTEYAKLFLKKLVVINKTSDMFIQNSIIKNNKVIQHFTIDPAPAYQLSDNNNAKFVSEIHPKGINNLDKIRAKSHFKKVRVEKYIYVTKYYFNIFGMRKSGNHYISQNLLSSFNSLLYFNDVTIGGLNFRNIQIYKDLDKRIQNKIKNCFIKTKTQKDGLVVRKFIDSILVGYEDYDFTLKKNHFNNKIYSSYKYNILIMRNIFDTIISRLILNQKRKSNLTLVDNIFLNKYKKYCLEYIGETNLLNNKICINYDFLINKNQYHISNVKKMTNGNFSLVDYNSTFGRNTRKRNTIAEKYSKLTDKNRELFKKIISDNNDIVELNKKIYGDEYIETIKYDLNNSKNSSIIPLEIKNYSKEIINNNKLISNNRNLISNNRNLISKKILCIGHPRTGTGTTTDYINQLGYNIGHEYMKNDGVSSWMLAVDDNYYPWGNVKNINQYHFDKIVHIVRNPFDAIPSIILENKFCDKSYNFRKRNIKKYLNIQLPNSNNNKTIKDDIETAIQTYVYWSKICELKTPNIVCKIEDTETLKALNPYNKKIIIKRKNKTKNKKYGGKIRNKPIITKDMYKNVKPELLKELEDFCKKYNYDYIL